MDQSDEALVVACRRGVEAAWQALITRYQRLIYSIPRRAGLDKEQSADIFQQVFAKLVEHIHRIERPAQIHAWLVTTARRETLNLLYREKTERRFDQESTEAGSEAHEVPDYGPLPDELLLRMEAQHRMRAAVATLDERCRKLLTLLFYRDEPPPYVEIAAILGIAEGSIGAYRARCLQKLFRMLKRQKI